jgi:5-methylcytosine-specific restriction endonuclease McrA
VIRIVRPALPHQVADRLPPLRDEIAAAKRADRVRTARAAWKRSTVRKAVHAPLREVLAGMAPGYERCMYCGDSQGTDIDHFEPLARNPLRTFDWLNHLLACSTCNSNLKRDRFPLDAKNKPLLIDPTTEDPFDHLLLTPALGVYHALTEKGRETISVCGLNRPVLTNGRVQARRVVLLCLRKWATGDDQDRHEAVLTVQGQPFADVCQALLRLALSPGAGRVFEDTPDALALLHDEELRAALLL